MTRQNCKNCGEPYAFDHLVTPGRATMICSACQKKIYVHTGQIHFDAPLSNIQANSSIKISLGQGVAVVQEADLYKKQKVEILSKKWQSINPGESEEKCNKTTANPKFGTGDMKRSNVQTLILLFLYIFFSIWIVFAISYIYKLIKFYPYENESVESMLFWVVLSLFCALLSLTAAEACKRIWSR